MLSISKGEIAGHSSVNKFGRNSAIASTATEVIWDGSSTSYPYPSTADITHILSGAADTQTIEVQGLDATWALVTQTKTLTGTTPVALDTPLIRVFRMKVISNTSPTGIVYATNASVSASYAQIDIGNNQTLMAIFTVPVNTTAYMTRYYATVNEVANKAVEGVIKLSAADRENDYVFQLKHVMGMDKDASSVIEHDFKPYYKFTEKTDIQLVFVNAIAQVADVSAGFDLILVEDGY